MAGTTANARIWSLADVHVAALGSTAPTDVASALDAAFDPVGFLDEDSGIEFAASRSVTDHYAYGGFLLRSGAKSEKHTFKFWALEENAVVHGLVNPGGSISTSGGVSTVSLKTWEPNPKAWVVELADGDYIERISIPRGEVIEVPDTQKLTDDGLAMIGLTVNCYAVNGVWGVKISSNPALAS